MVSAADTYGRNLGFLDRKIRNYVFSAWTEIMQICYTVYEGLRRTSVFNVHATSINDNPVKWESIEMSDTIMWHLLL
jgi:hypothetical protein